MLGVSPLRSNIDYEIQGEDMETLSIIGASEEGDFAELFESINFDDLFSGDGLPDLKMDPDIFFEFSFSEGDNSSVVLNGNNKLQDNDHDSGSGDFDKSASSDSGSSKGEEIVSKRDGYVAVNPFPDNNNKGVHKGRNKSSSSSYQSKNPHQQTKKKVKKVHRNPDLHRRFVEAVEQLGVDKAVPSKILEIMAVDCAPRHNIASHLQKYRSLRKHLLAREAEAANRSQGRQMHGAGGRGKREIRVVSPWVAPTIGFPPTPMPLHFRTLHVWGHPTMNICPPNPGQLPPHAPWPSHPHFQRGHQNAVPPGTPCFPQPLTTSRFGSPPTTTVAGIPPHAICKVDHSMPKPLVDFHPLKESIDAAIGDVLSKPWLPLPLGFKAPAIEYVMSELHREGISKMST